MGNYKKYTDAQNRKLRSLRCYLWRLNEKKITHVKIDDVRAKIKEVEAAIKAIQDGKVVKPRMHPIRKKGEKAQTSYKYISKSA